MLKEEHAEGERLLARRATSHPEAQPATLGTTPARVSDRSGVLLARQHGPVARYSCRSAQHGSKLRWQASCGDALAAVSRYQLGHGGAYSYSVEFALRKMEGMMSLAILVHVSGSRKKDVTLIRSLFIKFSTSSGSTAKRSASARG